MHILNSVIAEFFTEFGKLHRICKYAQNLAEQEIFRNLVQEILPQNLTNIATEFGK